jgi:hypothetical protein
LKLNVVTFLIGLKIRNTVIQCMDREIRCTQCKVSRPLSDFTNKNGKVLKTCIRCRERSKRSRTKNKEVVNERSRKWKENHKDRIKEYNKSLRDGTDWSEVKKEKNIEDKKAPSRRKEHIFIDGVEYKNCSHCHENRELSEYVNCPASWDSLRPTCNVCLHETRVENKERITAYNKDYWQKTKEEQTIKNREWKENNRDRYNKYMREYKRDWEKEQRRTNPQFKMAKNLRTRLYVALRDQSAKKDVRTFDLIGCDQSFLRGWLEAKFRPGMTWENYGKWHIDHIKPCASFDLTDLEQQKECCSYKNLQPLWAHDNISKGCKIMNTDEGYYTDFEPDEDINLDEDIYTMVNNILENMEDEDPYLEDNEFELDADTEEIEEKEPEIIKPVVVKKPVQISKTVITKSSETSKPKVVPKKPVQTTKLVTKPKVAPKESIKPTITKIKKSIPKR